MMDTHFDRLLCRILVSYDKEDDAEVWELCSQADPTDPEREPPSDLTNREVLRNE